MLGDTEVAELTALRRRAYSADADIARDPAAIARLEELERAMRPRPAPDPDPIAVPLSARGPAGSGDGGGAGTSAGAWTRDGVRAGASGADWDGVRARDGVGIADRDEPAGMDREADAGSDAFGGHDRNARREGGTTPDLFAAPEATVAAPAQADSRRRRWPARLVVAAAVPAAALLLASGFAFGAWGSPSPAASPTPSSTHINPPPRPSFADSYAWARSVRTWDIESLRVLARIDGTRIWAGSVGDGATTCVAIDDQRTNPVVCRTTTDVDRDGIVIEASRSRTDDTTGVVFVVNPYGEPTVMVERLTPAG